MSLVKPGQASRVDNAPRALLKKPFQRLAGALQISGALANLGQMGTRRAIVRTSVERLAQGGDGLGVATSQSVEKPHPVGDVPLARPELQRARAAGDGCLDILSTVVKAAAGEEDAGIAGFALCRRRESARLFVLGATELAEQVRPFELGQAKVRKVGDEGRQDDARRFELAGRDARASDFEPVGGRGVGGELRAVWRRSRRRRGDRQHKAKREDGQGR